MSAAPGPHLPEGTDRRVHLRRHIAVGRPQQWPERREDAQRHAGVVLWCLSIAAAGWEPRERLTRMCTIPVSGVLDHPRDVGSWAMDVRVLRPLWWFGLLEHRDEEVEGGRLERRHLYRKSPLFDRFLSFDVVLEAAGGVRQLAVLAVVASAALLAPVLGRAQRLARAGLLACAALAAAGSATEFSLLLVKPRWAASELCSVPEAARQSVFRDTTDWSHYLAPWPDESLEDWMDEAERRPVPPPDRSLPCWPRGGVS